MPGTRSLQLVVLLAFLLALAVPFFTQTAADNVLTNADVISMVKAGIPENIIVRDIRMSRTDFGTSPAALIELKSQGASERIMDAVLDSQMGAGQSKSAVRPAARGSARSAAHGLPRLPPFEADVKVKGNADAKIKVSRNQVKVERSGVPLFTVKWKEKLPANK